MQYSIENDILRLTVDSHGAEPVSVIHKPTGAELLWQADPAVWKRHAPILFPYTGKLTGGKMLAKGVEYAGGQHGFARDVEHTMTHHADNLLEFELHANAETLPKWPYAFVLRSTFTLEGDPAIPVIVDSWMKGLRDFDVAKAYEAMRKSATTPGAQNRMRPDLDPYIEKGYIPLGFYAKDLAGDTSVSHALEYYMADAALSLLADSLGHGDDARLFRARSLGYKRYYSPESGTLRPLHPDGTFLSPFDPKAGENFTAAPGFHEGSAWNYTFYVPHDVEGLAKLMGGRRKFIDKLQMVFDEGLYDPANEPDIAYAYLFSRFRGEEWRTQRETRRLLERYFTTAPDGIPGNDDTGTMSAWAVFTMLGLYPDCPGEPYYTLTSPTFDRVEIDTERGTLVIEKSGEGYIDRMTLGDKPLKNYRILHDELLKGGKLTFELQTGK